MAEKLSLTVHHRNAKGKIVRKTPYRLAVVKGVSIYEMPVGSGEFYLADGTRYEGVAPLSNKPSKEAQKTIDLEAKLAELQAKLDAAEAKEKAQTHIQSIGEVVTPVKPVDSQAQKKS